MKASVDRHFMAPLLCLMLMRGIRARYKENKGGIIA
jgi:hypothetical protein